MTKTNRLLLIMNVLLALILVLVLIQFAPKPAFASTGEVTACANKKTGALRLATKACTKKEKQVSWSVAGPAGPAGATGAAGTQATKDVTIWYTGSTSIYGCGDGQDLTFQTRYIYAGTLFSASDLSQSYNWRSVRSACQITLKVLQ